MYRGAFATSLVRTVYRHEPGAAWQTLHPLHPERLDAPATSSASAKPRWRERCGASQLVSVSDEQATVPGWTKLVQSKAVMVRYLLKLPGIASAQPITHTVHVFAVDEHWAGDGLIYYASYATGSCPSG